MIGSIERDTDAERFSDYLLAQKIENMVEESNSGHWAVWVEKDDDIDRAKTELDTFLRDPSDGRYAKSSAAAARAREEWAKQKKRKRTQYIDVRTRWGQAQQWAAPLTLALIALSAIVSLGTRSIMGGRAANRELLDPLLFVSMDSDRLTKFATEHPGIDSRFEFAMKYWLDHLKRGQIWRIFTPMYVHWDFFHFLFNMFWMRDLGGMIEIQRGTRRLAWLVLLCAFFAHCGEYIWSASDGISAFGGMSGVVYGLFGYVWVKGRFEPQEGLGISPQATMIMIAWLIICAVGIIGNVANAAHVVGMLAGAAAAYMPYEFRRRMRARGS
jgi:GlpG protein